MSIVNYEDEFDLPPIDYDQDKVPKAIKERAAGVRNAFFGSQNKEFLAQIGEIVSLYAKEAVESALATQLRQDAVEDFNNQVIQEMTDKDVISAPEIIEGRDGEATLKARLDRDKNAIEQELDNITKSQIFYDGTERLQLLIDQATTNRKRIKVPAGTYIINDSIVNNLSTVDLDIVGDGATEGQPKTRLLWRGGPGNMFDFTDSRYVNFRDIEISGYNPGDFTKVVLGATGIKTTGNLKLTNVVLMGFDTLAEWGGGYYHKFSNCEFRYFKTGFKNVTAFNYNFHLCRFTDFQTIVDVSNGTGPLNLIQCSIESWSGTAIRCLDGAKTLINIIASYIENYPSKTPPEGIDGDYKASHFIFGGGVVNILNSAIVTSGIKRVIYTSSATRKVTSKGNFIRYNSTNSDLECYLYNLNTIESVEMDDYAEADGLGQLGSYTPVYISDPGGLPENSNVYDAFKKVKLAILKRRTPVFAPNWSNTGGATTPLTYARNNGRIILEGVVSGTGSEGDIFILPEGYRPVGKVLHFGTTTTNGTNVVITVYGNTGRVTSNYIGSAVILSRIDFYI